MVRTPGSCSRHRLASVAVLISALLWVAACSSAAGGHSGSTSTARSSSAAKPGLLASVTTSDYVLSVSGSHSSEALSASPSATSLSNNQPYISAAGAGVDVRYSDQSQPSSPLTLDFDMGKNSTFSPSDTLVPAVIAMGESSSEPEVLRSAWNPATHVLSADTTHLSSFWPGLIDVGKIKSQVGGAIAGYLGWHTRSLIASVSR